MDPSALNISDIQALRQQQQLQRLQQQQLLIATNNLPQPMDTSGIPRVHGNPLALAISPDLSPSGAVGGGLPFHSVGNGGHEFGPSVSPLGMKLPHGAMFPGTRMLHRPLKRPREKFHGQDYYYRQWRRLKKTIKEMIFLNSSTCDEVIRVEEKLARVKEERRFLLRKLLQCQSLHDGSNSVTSHDSHHPTPSSSKTSKSPANHAPTPERTTESSAKKSASRKKASGGGGGESKKKQTSNQAAKDLLESLQQTRPKKSKSQSNRKTIPPMQLDSLGRPIFPMILGDLTLHSIGEIVPDRNTFNTHDCIYPAGYCSTRVFASLTHPTDKCLYTCKISDCGDIPEFEIAPEESTEHVFRGSTPKECHSQLLQVVNQAIGTELLLSPTKSNAGADFFGLTNPVVQNLIQSCPGSKKCSGYKWIRFEINKSETNENVAVGKMDPTVSFECFLQCLQQVGASRSLSFSPSEHSTNLRSLLTKANVAFSGQM